MDMTGGNTNKRAESGMVSILVTIIMMIVISLIILGISQVTRSNQREQLNSQLSTQAYYAAESGLNQAVKYFQTNPTAAVDTVSANNCTQFITGNLGGAMGTYNMLDSSTGTSYTCLMVDSTPPSLQKAPLTQDANTVWHVRDASGANFSRLEFKWKPNSGTQFTGANNTCNATGFPAYKNWKCAFGVLRLDLVNVSGTVATSNLNGLQSASVTRALYLVPTFTVSGVTTQALTGNPGQVVNVKCTTGASSLCDIKLTFGGAWPAGSDYFVRMSVIYQDTDSLTLVGTDAAGVAQFAGGQAVIDVTGKAQDELRRVQARIPLTEAASPIPNFGLQTTDNLCKQLAVAPGLNTLDTCP